MKTGICYTDLGALPQKMRSHKKKKKKNIAMSDDPATL